MFTILGLVLGVSTSSWADLSQRFAQELNGSQAIITASFHHTLAQRQVVFVGGFLNEFYRDHGGLNGYFSDNLISARDELQAQRIPRVASTFMPKTPSSPSPGALKSRT